MLSPQPTNVSQGNEVLGKIFGSKDVSSTVAHNAAAQSGLSPDLLKKMLPMLAMLVAGYMAKQRSGRRAPTPPAGGLGRCAGRPVRWSGRTLVAPSGLGSMLDMNHDGNPLDDILHMAGKGLR